MTHYKKRSILISGALLILGLVLAGPASAHHSVQAQFDIHKTFTVSGTVAKVEWINPHSYLTINVKDADGKDGDWEFELGSPNGLMRLGWTRNSLKPGDVITVEGFRAKDGSNLGNARSVVLGSGRKIFAGSSNESENSK